MSKKILSVLVAIMMVVSMLSVCAFAANYESDKDVAKYTQDWALSEPVDNGDGTWSVDVLLTTNYPTGSIEFVLTNSDTTVATAISATLGDAIPESYGASINQPNSNGKYTIFADTSSAGSIDAEEIDGVIATIVYSCSGSGSAEIAIKNDAKSATNPTGTLVAPRMSDGNLISGDFITGQTVTVGEAVVIGGAAEAPTLGVIDGTIGVIDTTRRDMYCDESGYGLGDETFTGYIYGVEPEYSETWDSVFEIVGEGDYEFIETENGAGTGSVLNVLDLDGNVVESYVLVIFGDVNGDGVVDTSDSGDIEFHDTWMYEASSNGMRMEYAYQVFAGDINCDESVDTSDSGDIEFHDTWMYENGSDGMRMYQADVMANIA